MPLLAETNLTYFMKKLFFLAFALLAASAVSAQTPRAKTWDRVWFSVAYTPKFMLSESISSDTSPGNYKQTVHNYAFEVGYMVSSRFSLGLGAGYERYWLKTGSALDALPLYLHTNYFYGKRGGGLFNYARLGALLSLDGGAQTGFTGGLGVGYRLKLARRLGVDFKAGYDYSGAPVNTSFWASDLRSRSWGRHSLSLGVGLVF